MRLRVGLALAGALALMAPGAAAATAVQELPDLTEAAPAAISTFADSSQGGTQYELVFASAAENRGDGPIALHGTADGTPEEMSVTQLVTNSDGSTTQRPVSGLMRYVRGNHNHFHYLGFEHYYLVRPSDGAIVGSDHKTGFCFGDVNAVVANPPQRQFTFAGWCQQDKPTATSVDMGITNGYEDIYDPQKEGQYIIVNGVPAGDYYLVHHVNEDQSLLEKDYSNNTSSALVRLSWPRGVNSAPSATTLRSCEGSATCPGPLPGTGDAVNVTASSATLTGTVDPNGNDTTASFEYGPTAAYGTATPSEGVGSGNSPVSLSATIDALNPNTTYHYRLDANAGGNVFAGDDGTFTTAPLPGPALPGSPIQPPARSSGSFYVRSVHSLRGGRVAVRLTLPAAGATSLKATVHALGASSTTVGAGHRSARKGGTISVYLRPTRAGLALLRSHRLLPAHLRVTFTPPGAHARVLSLRISLRR